MSEEPSFPGISIIKQLYKTKNSLIYLINDSNSYITEPENKINVLKSILKTSISGKDYEMLKRERDFYDKNKNKKFPKFIHSYQDSLNLYMEISFIEGLNLSQLLLNDHLLKFNFPKSNINLYLNLTSQIIDMIDNLHKERFIYRDLKLNNIIIDKKLNLYLVDFGFVKNLPKNSNKTSTICGTPHMKAPEILLTKNKTINEYNGYAVDIYSIGIILYEIYYGKAPFGYSFNKENEEEFEKKILNGINDKFFDENIDSDLKDLIVNCLNINPEKRFKMEDIKKHKFFSKNGGFENNINTNEELSNSEDSQVKSFIDYIKFNGEFKEDYEMTEEKKRMDDIFNNFF